MTRLTLLHTNDLHGRVPQLLRIATLVRQIRAEVETAGGNCLYVDAGDSEDTTLLESSLTKGSAMNAILRGAGCDYVTLGNAIPVRYGPGAVADLSKHFGRPLLCANFLDQNDQLVDGLAPFAVHDFGGFKFGIIGATDPGRVYNTFFKMHVIPPDELLPGLIQQVHAQGAQTILLLSHLGLRDDKRVAENVTGIHLIVGGHSHDLLDPPLQINGTIVAQAGEYGNFLGRLDLEFDPVSGNVTHFKSALLPIDESMPRDPAAEAVVESERVRVQQIMSRVVGVLATDFDLADERECAAGNLLADALLDRVKGTEIAIALAGHWETGLEAGPLTQGALFAANRSTANPAKVELTGAQIEQYLRIGFNLEKALQTPHGLRGRKVGFPHVAGMTVRYDASNLETLEIRVGGQALERERKYIVAATDMEFSDWLGYLVIPEDQIEFEVPTIVPEVLEEYVARRSPIDSVPSKRINVK